MNMVKTSQRFLDSGYKTIKFDRKTIILGDNSVKSRQPEKI